VCAPLAEGNVSMTTPPPMAATWDLLDQISLEFDQAGA